MRAIGQGLFFCLLSCLAGCGTNSAALQSAGEHADFQVAVNEEVPADCAVRYKDLQENYLTLLKKTGELYSYRGDLGEFINEYATIKAKLDSVAAENKELKTENEKLTLLTKHLQSRVEVLDDKLKLVRDTVTHLVSSMHQKSPVTFAGLKTNPMTDGIVLDDAFMFSAGQSTLTAEGKELLEHLARTLNGPEYKDFLVRVDGHTDSTPVSKTKKTNIDNWFLGAKRAHAVLEHLAASGIAGDRLSLASFGSTQPIEQNHAAEAGAPRNRRVEVVLLQQRKSI